MWDVLVASGELLTMPTSSSLSSLSVSQEDLYSLILLGVMLTLT